MLRKISREIRLKRIQRAAARKDKKKEKREKYAKIRKMELDHWENMYENKGIKMKLRRTVRYKVTE